MKIKGKKKFPASLDNLYEMLGYISDYTKEQGFSKDWISKIELAFEEALVNIISYGYPNQKGIIELACTIPKSGGITIAIYDVGVPYNPLTNPIKFDPSDSIETRGIGGYGIFFILKVMDEVEYKREGGKNILLMTKFLK